MELAEKKGYIVRRLVIQLVTILRFVLHFWQMFTVTKEYRSLFKYWTLYDIRTVRNTIVTSIETLAVNRIAGHILRFSNISLCYNQLALKRGVFRLVQTNRHIKTIWLSQSLARPLLRSSSGEKRKQNPSSDEIESVKSFGCQNSQYAKVNVCRFHYLKNGLSLSQFFLLFCRLLVLW